MRRGVAKALTLVPAALLGLSALHCGDASTGGPSGSTTEGASSAAAGVPIHPKGSTSLCLGVAGHATANGSAVEIAACDGSASQQWTYDGTSSSGGSLRTFGTACLDVPDGNAANGMKLQIWSCTANNKNQRWTESGATLQWVGESKCLDLTGGNLAAGTVVQSWTCAPGGNFDLSVWELQEPVGSPGSPTTFGPSKLTGANGHQDSFFFTDPTDGSMTFWDPESGVTTLNSDFPRCELREMTPSGAAAEWPSAGTNTLSATLKATVIPASVVVGQIHLGTGTPASTKPLLELFYHSSGAIFLYIEHDPAGGSGDENPVGNVPLGTPWSYVIGLSGNTITLVVDGGEAQSFAMSPSYDQENMYFKAGNYDQTAGASTTLGAKVQFYALSAFHGK